MNDEVAEIVKRLLRSRSVPLLRLIRDADLDGPVEAEPNAAAVVQPYRWLIEHVGDGVRLTQAGYLPPAFVIEAMAELGWLNNIYGKGNREENTPVLDLRESAQRIGLVRKNRGQLLATKLGRKLVEDAGGLWWQLAAGLPDARSEPQRHAGLVYLLMVAAGRTRNNALLAEAMTVLGWAEGGSYDALSADAAFIAARDTWALFDRLGLLPGSQRWDVPELPPSPAAIRLARAALLGRTGSPPPAAQAQADQTSEAVELTLMLSDIHPSVWRRITVPASFTLRQLHDVLQTAMGWKDYHLHLFDVDGVLYGDVEDLWDRPTGAEDAFTVGQAADAAQAFSYEYDFGDGWHHDIRVGQRIAGSGAASPRLVAGERACPPEECGGPPGYGHLLEVLADPAHEEHRELKDWLGGAHDAETFDVVETNAYVELLDRWLRRD
jgi:hypothetical protein